MSETVMNAARIMNMLPVDDQKFAYEFWMGRPSFLDKMPLSQRIKLTLKYFRR